MKVHMKKLAAFMLAGALVLSGFGQTTVEAEESTPEEQGIEAVANENAAAKIGDIAYNTSAPDSINAASFFICTFIFFLLITYIMYLCFCVYIILYPGYF